MFLCVYCFIRYYFLKYWKWLRNLHCFK